MADTTTSYYVESDSTGLTSLDTSTLRSDIASEFQSIISSSLDTSEGTVAGSLVDCFTALLSGQLENTLNMTNSLNPYYNDSNYLRQLLALIGLEVEEDTYSTVTLTFSGTQGVNISSGTQCLDTSGNLWETLEDAEIATTGTVSVSAQCTIAGDTTADADTITTITTESKSIGVSSVTNSSAAIAGVSSMSNVELRNYYFSSLANQGANSYQALTSNLGKLGGSYNIYINNSSDSVTKGSTTVDAGNLWVCFSDDIANSDIANAIYDSWTAGLGTSGSESYTVSSPISTTINFDYATEVPVYVKVTVNVNGSSATIGDIEDVILDGISDYLTVGSELNGSAITNIIYDTYSTIRVTSVSLSIDNSTFDYSITPAVNEIYTLAIGDISVSE